MVALRRILVAEDQPDLAHLIGLHLEDLGCTIELCSDGRDALDSALQRGPWSLILLDIGLPNVDGLEICRQVRQSESYTPILMLTARAGEYDRVLGLDTGADDYLTKPFSIVELSARVKAILRRVQHLARRTGDPAAPKLRTLRRGDLELDLDRRLARRADQSLELTGREFDLLALLMLHPRAIFTRAQLLDRVWGTTHDGFEHTVNSHINRLRAKLEPVPSQPRYIVTVWGRGYRLGVPSDGDASC